MFADKDNASLEGCDYAVILGYFLLIWAVGYLAGLRERTSSRKYFLAGNTLPWYVVGSSFIAANVSSEQLIGMIGSAVIYGICVANLEWLNVMTFSLLIWFFIPFLLASKVFTIPEFLERRFNPTLRHLFAAITVVANVVAFLAPVLYGGALALHTLFAGELDSILGRFLNMGAFSETERQWLQLCLALGLLAVISGFWAIWGGLSSLAWMDVVTVVFILLGGLSVTLLGLEKLAGPNGSIVDGFQEMLRNNRATAGPHAEAVTRHVTQLAGSSEATGYNRLSCFQSQTHPIIPLSSMLFAIFSVSIWYNVLNQFMIQRVLGARDMYHARMGIVFAGFLKLILPLAVVFPGLILFARHPEILFQSWDQVKPDADRGYVSMIRELVPAGFRGLFLAALFGAIQSTVSAALNSTGTIVTMDLFRRVRPAATERTLVRIGAMTTAAAILIAVVLAALIGRWQASLFEYIQTLYAFFAPPFAAVFLLGILWRRTNSRGALGAVAVGFTFGLGLKLFLHALQTTAWLPRLLGSETVARLKPITEWLGPYFNQATVSWILCMVVCIGVSLLSPPPRPEQVTDQLTFNWKKLNIFSNLGSHWYTSVVFWWAVFVATIIAALLTFSGLVFPVVQELVAI